ncbi:MAG: type III secretion protein, partial [Achromobacter sp.]|uniref:type III secretion system stalk subunit SctO n=1 Tax=Achromobacter sp. TaxID=134375 RepID=UPI00258A5D4C
MSVFDELLAIKRFREGQAEIAVSRQRLRHAEADAARRDSEAALASYRDEAVRRERALYSDLCSRVVRVREIETVLQDVAGLREGERQREQAVETAERRLEEENQALAASRQQHRQAARLTGKFVE